MKIKIKNKSALIKLVAFCLTVALFLTALPISIGSAADIVIPVENEDYFVGETFNGSTRYQIDG